MAKGKKVDLAGLVFIRNNAPTMTIAQLADALDISTCWAGEICRKNGIKAKPSPKFKKTRAPGESWHLPRTEAHEIAAQIRRRKIAEGTPQQEIVRPPAVLSVQEQIFQKYGV